MNVQKFVSQIKNIKKEEFFSWDNLIQVKEIKDIVTNILNMEMNMDDVLYYNLPTTGFRFVYFGTLLNTFSPSLPQLNLEKIKDLLAEEGFLMFFDDEIVFIAAPESFFEKPYIDKFKPLYEDFYLQ